MTAKLAELQLKFQVFLHAGKKKGGCMTTIEKFDERMEVVKEIRANGIDPVEFCDKCKLWTPDTYFSECMSHMLKSIEERKHGIRRSNNSK